MPFLTSRRVAIAGAVAVLVHLAAALVLQDQRYAAGLVSNVGQAVVQFGILGVMLACVVSSSGRQRAFWALMSCGVLLWLIGQCHWIYYENIRHIQVPNPSPLDVTFFMH